ncbi:efflux transporter outer membrane subunit [Vibrio hippocampi]|uniref:Outer membrane protein OprM n=1 Tax=Vibrio hippocampi TaxID=654686 RepID=A0ABM8ZLJ1_9VIBR|nr:efflux transporter outer membrane subunit [Vibrio hippocampi]CAH0529004.1 Outer membrane protein OprM [Vibrio hippocampi]
MNINYSLSRVKPIALFVGSLLLTGCAVGPDYQAPSVPMAEAYLYSTTDNAIKQDYWWHEFHDETLNQLVADAQQQNIPLKLAAQRIKMANSYRTVVESFKVPSISVGAGYVNYQLSKNDSLLGPALNPLGSSVSGLPDSVSGMTLLDNQHDGGFVAASIAWELDLFGRIDRQSNAAEIRVEQAQIYQSGLTTLITADLVHNYLQLRGAQQRYQLLEANVADQQKTLDLVRKVVRAGYGSDLDIAQAESMLAATESLLPQLEIAQQVHKQRLSMLLGEPLTQIDIRVANAQPLPELTGVIPVGLPSDLLQRRPDIRMAEREMAAVNEELAASVANRYPKFFLTGAPGLSAGSFDDLFSSDSFGWVGSVGVSWNVFDGGRGKAAVDINQARFDSALLSYQHAVDSAFTEVDSLLFTYGKSQENQQRLNRALASAEKALGKAESLYQAGLIDHVSVLDAQRQKRMMEDRQIVARLQTAQVTIGLHKALGGDWSLAREETSATETNDSE